MTGAYNRRMWTRKDPEPLVFELATPGAPTYLLEISTNTGNGQKTLTLKQDGIALGSPFGPIPAGDFLKEMFIGVGAGL